MDNKDRELMKNLEARFFELFSDLDEELPGEEIENTITFNDAKGNDVEYEIMDLIKYGEDEYVVLLPAEDCDDADNVVILKLPEAENDEDWAYVGIDDDDIKQAVFQVFKDEFEGDFNFAD